MTLSVSDKENVWLYKSAEYYSYIIEKIINERTEFPLWTFWRNYIDVIITVENQRLAMINVYYGTITITIILGHDMVFVFSSLLINNVF